MQRIGLELRCQLRSSIEALTKTVDEEIKELTRSQKEIYQEPGQTALMSRFSGQ